MSAPELVTERLILRPHVEADFAPYAAFLADPDRTRHSGGPVDARKAWWWFAADVGQWALSRLGSLAITRRTDGAYIGQVNLLKPPHSAEPELGWGLLAEHEGQGFATEAGRALRDWGFGPRGLVSMVSYVDDGNRRSERVVARLGGVLDPNARPPFGEPTRVFRYRPEVVS